jgi:hypothetical protein
MERARHTCGGINQLQDQGTSGDNARSSGQEVPAMSWGSQEDQGLRELPSTQEYLSCHWEVSAGSTALSKKTLGHLQEMAARKGGKDSAPSPLGSQNLCI